MFRPLAAVVAAAAMLANLAVDAAAVAPASGAASCVRTFTAPRVPNDSPFGVTAGPDGTWYSDGPTINQIRAGHTTTYRVPDPTTASIGWLTWNRRSRIWFADRGNGRLGTITEDGTIREVQIPTGSAGAAVPQGIVVRRGSAIWFTDQQNNRIGRFSLVSRHFRFYPVPSAFPLGLVRGGDGDLYFTERSVDKVARFDPHTHLFTEWTLPKGAFPNRLTVGPDGTVWFTTLLDSAVWHIFGGYLHRRPLPGGPVGITYWHRHLWTALFTAGKVARLSLRGRLQKTWTMPDPTNAGPLQIAASEGHLWTTGNLDVYRVDPTC